MSPREPSRERTKDMMLDLKKLATLLAPVLLLVVPVKQTAPYRNSSANRTDTLLLRRSRSSSFLTGISDLMVGAFLI